MRHAATFFPVALLTLSCTISDGDDAIKNEIQFDKVVLEPEIGKVCYAVTAADVDGDSRLDAVAISEREAVWFRNPDWKKYTMVRDAVPLDHVCIAAEDIDADGKVDFALGAGWPKNGGSIHWLQRGESLDDLWTVHSISAEPWTHRMRFADVLGRGRDQLVVTPLNGSGESGIRLLAFPIPENPAVGPWKGLVLDGSLNRAHNHWHLPPSKAGDADVTIVASQEGLNFVNRKPEGGFSVSNIVDGAAGEKPNQKGCGEVKSGRFGTKYMLATIEPMHGTDVVVYLGDTMGDRMQRIVLDDSFVQGHAIWCADLNGDGLDEVIAACRETSKLSTGTKPPGIYIYRADNASGNSWSRQLLDAPMACEDVWCADFNGDKKIDILAGGRATHDVNLYLNHTIAK